MWWCAKPAFSRLQVEGFETVAHKDASGCEPPIIKVRVKSSDSKIGDKDVSALLGKLGPTNMDLWLLWESFPRRLIHCVRY
jgi:hypothetical protein